MDEKMRQEIALHRWAVIAEAANGRLTSSERGAVVRAIAARQHAHPDGTARRYSRGTIDRWLRAWLFLIVDDHSRLLVDGRFYDRENARICQELLRRAITRRGIPDILYASDNGAPFANAWLARTCAVLGIRLVHSKPYSPQGRG